MTTKQTFAKACKDAEAACPYFDDAEDHNECRNPIDGKPCPWHLHAAHRAMAVAFADELADQWCDHPEEPPYDPCRQCRAALLSDCGLEEK